MLDFDFTERQSIGVPETFTKILAQATADDDWNLAGHRFGDLMYDLLPEGMIMCSWLEPWDRFLYAYNLKSDAIWRAAFVVWVFVVYPDMAALIPKEHVTEVCSGAYDQVMTYDRVIDFRSGMFAQGPRQFFSEKHKAT